MPGSFLLRQQHELAQFEAQTQAQWPGSEHLGDTIPVAAALTSVFQDQFITGDIGRRPQSNDDDDESD